MCERIDQPAEIARHAFKLLPLDEKGGRGLNAKLVALGLFLLDRVRVLAAIQTRVERGRIQTHLYGKTLQIILRKGALVFARLVPKDIVSILPELVLVARTIGGFSRPLRFRPDKGKVVKDNFGLSRIHILGHQLL